MSPSPPPHTHTHTHTNLGRALRDEPTHISEQSPSQLLVLDAQAQTQAQAWSQHISTRAAVEYSGTN